MQILVYWWDWQRATDRVIEVSGRRRELVGYRCHWEDGAVWSSDGGSGSWNSSVKGQSGLKAEQSCRNYCEGEGWCERPHGLSEATLSVVFLGWIGSVCV